MAQAGEATALTGAALLNHCRVYAELSPMPWGYKVIDTNPSVDICLTFMKQFLENPAAAGGADGKYCLPENLTPGQLAGVYVDNAGLQPQWLTQQAGSAVKHLLEKTFPCR
jgi:hypothetical protein